MLDKHRFACNKHNLSPTLSASASACIRDKIILIYMTSYDKQY